MRIWSLHPKYLDTKGLVALWRETLLAQKVLQEKTKGYKNHPQLIRFRSTSDPLGAIGAYLTEVAKEADKRGYNFDKTKIFSDSFSELIPVTKGQVQYEFDHLLSKLSNREPVLYQKFMNETKIETIPLFRLIDGGVENWEKVL